MSMNAKLDKIVALIGELTADVRTLMQTSSQYMKEIEKTAEAIEEMQISVRAVAGEHVRADKFPKKEAFAVGQAVNVGSTEATRPSDVGLYKKQIEIMKRLLKGVKGNELVEILKEAEPDIF